MAEPTAPPRPARAPATVDRRCAVCGHDGGDYEAVDRARVPDLARERLELSLAGLPAGVLDDDLVGRWRAALAAHLAAGDLHGTAHLLHEVGAETALTAALDLGRGLGEVAAVSLSSGGVPKLPVEVAEVTGGGLAGDAQASRQHHGHPWQAVSLWSLATIEQLAAEGHPIFPGACGENLTLAGLDWTALRPGVVLAAGSAVLELTAPATPCAKNARWFADRDVTRIDHGLHPGQSRWYASLLEPGTVRRGDPVHVLHPT